MMGEVRFTRQEMSETPDVVKMMYERLLDAGCPISGNGSLDPGVQGFSSWTVDTNEFVVSWEEKRNED